MVLQIEGEREGGRREGGGFEAFCLHPAPVQKNYLCRKSLWVKTIFFPLKKHCWRVQMMKIECCSSFFSTMKTSGCFSQAVFHGMEN